MEKNLNFVVNKLKVIFLFTSVNTPESDICAAFQPDLLIFAEGKTRLGKGNC